MSKDITDTEILDWLERERPVTAHPVPQEGFENWLVFKSLKTFRAPTLREAVEKAAREDGDD